ncbi:hypothetical protein C8R42DRAFT_646235 [Lentinula raphanica]|nr:hypothetical protein C8R42DRAFT_646235 [Lentinula raphanica]
MADHTSQMPLLILRFSRHSCDPLLCFFDLQRSFHSDFSVFISDKYALECCSALGLGLCYVWTSKRRSFHERSYPAPNSPAFPAPNSPAPNSTFPAPTAPPLPSIPPEPEAQRPIATYAFIQSPGPGSEGMQDSAAFMAELKTYSKAFIEDRIFRHIGITAKQDEDSNVEPLHSLINWGWNLTTKDAALVIAKTVRLDTWRFMSASAVVAARVSEDDYWVVPTPIVVRVWLRSRDFEVYFDPDSQPLAPFPIPYDTNAIHGARFKVRYNPALDDPIDDSYAALLRLRGASLTHSDQH